MPKPRITRARRTKIRIRLEKVLLRRGGLTALTNEAGVYAHVIYRVMDNKLITEENAEKLEAVLDEWNIAPLSSNYITEPTKRLTERELKTA